MSKIVFLGQSNEVDNILCLSDLFLLPSETESFGLAALEAMACEVPVISSNAGGIPELNINGVTGFTSPVGDIQDMTNNALHILSEDNLNRFKHQALEQARKFDINEVMPIYESFYNEVSQSVLAH